MVSSYLNLYKFFDEIYWVANSDSPVLNFVQQSSEI